MWKACGYPHFNSPESGSKPDNFGPILIVEDCVACRLLYAGYQRLKKSIFLEGNSMSYIITIDNDKCNGDGECVDVCPTEVYELQDGKAVAVNEDECLGCESCIEVCEQDAITIEEQ